MRLTALIIVKNFDPVPPGRQQAAVNRHSADSTRAGRGLDRDDCFTLHWTDVRMWRRRNFGLGAFYCYDSTLPVLAGAAGERGRGSERATLISFDLPLRRAAATSDEDAAKIIIPSTRGGRLLDVLDCTRFVSFRPFAINFWHGIASLPIPQSAGRGGDVERGRGSLFALGTGRNSLSLSPTSTGRRAATTTKV